MILEVRWGLGGGVGSWIIIVLFVWVNVLRNIVVLDGYIL